MTDIRCKEEAKDIRCPVRVTSENQHNVTKHIYTVISKAGEVWGFKDFVVIWLNALFYFKKESVNQKYEISIMGV